MTTNPRSPRKFKWLQPTDNIPEMEVEDCRRLFLESFHVGSAYVEGTNNMYKFLGESMNEFLPDTPRRIVHATKRPTHLTFDPITLINLLERFDISEDEFRNAYNAMFASPPSDTPDLDNVLRN